MEEMLEETTPKTTSQGTRHQQFTSRPRAPESTQARSRPNVQYQDSWDNRSNIPQQQTFNHDLQPDQSQCYFCGKPWPHPQGRKQCPSYGILYNFCGKSGHFASVCHSSTKTTSRPKQGVCATQSGQPAINAVAQSASSSDSEIFSVTVNSLSHDSNISKVLISVNGTSMQFTLDTGASVNIISESTLKKSTLKHELAPTDTEIFAYGASKPLPDVGCFQVCLSKGLLSTQATLYIVKGTAAARLHLSLVSLKSQQVYKQSQAIHMTHLSKTLFHSIPNCSPAKVNLTIIKCTYTLTNLFCL